jgi:hypothetical protein
MKSLPKPRLQTVTAIIAGSAGLLVGIDLSCAQAKGSEAAPALPWQAVASSADGNLLLAAANGSSIYRSTNAGATWDSTSAPTNLWQAVATSANGAKMIAAASVSFQSGDPPEISGDGLIYLSTNSGAAWMPATAPNNAWSCVASSADGIRLIAAASVLRSYGGAFLSGDGLIYRSINAGLTWNRTSAPSDNWKSIACSSDGTRLVATIDTSINSGNGLVYISTNAGLTWVQSLVGNGFSSVACSADGTRLVAADPCAGPCPPPWTHDYIFVSTNSGTFWAVTPAPGAPWSGVASSADGMTLAAVSGKGPAGIFISRDGGATWAQTALPGASWTAVACSVDGGRIVGAAQDGRLATLPYAGPWRTAPGPATPWIAMASSEDGTKLFAIDGASIYSSTNSGAAWSPTAAPFEAWIAVACSADGAKLAAAPQFDRLYLSNDSGATFTPSGPTNQWSSIASSADGTRLAAASGWGLILGSLPPDVVWDCPLGDGLIYVSSDSGATWSPTSAPSNNWSSVASSADGTELIAAANNDIGFASIGLGRIFISRDSGVSWSATTTPLEAGWGPVASSADGTTLVALATVVYATYRVDGPAPGGGFWSDTVDETDTFVYISTDSGATWEPSDTPVGTWGSATISADGTKIVLSTSGTAAVLHLPSPPPMPPCSPLLSIGKSGPNPFLTWIVPSTPFTLQQTSDLSSPNWVDITNEPRLNLTSLRNELTLPPLGPSAFYRLKRP